MRRRRAIRPAPWTDLWPLIALAITALLSIGLLEWSYRQLSAALAEQTTALDNMTQARLNLSRSYLIEEQAGAGNATVLPQDAIAYIDRAVLAVDDWLQGHSLLARMSGASPRDAQLQAQLRDYRAALVSYRTMQLDARAAGASGSTGAAIDRRVAYSALERQADTIEQRVYQRLAETTRLQSRWHLITLLLWSGFLAILGVTVLRVTEVRRATVHSLAASEQRFRVQADASRAFAEVQPATETVLDTVVTQVAAHIGDGCAVSLLDDDTNALLESHIAHREPAAAQMIRELLANTPPRVGEGLMGRVVQTGDAVFLPQISPREYSAIGRTVLQPYVERHGVHSLLAVPLRGRNRMVGVLVLLRDQSPEGFGEYDLQLAQEIADRAALVIENVRLYQQAQDALQMRDVFLSIAAHELRTPLTSLLGHAYRLNRRAERNETLGSSERRSLEAMQLHGKRLNALIEELLDVSRLELGRFVIRREPLDLRAVVERVVAEMRPNIEYHQLEARIPQQPVLISGDVQHLEQVLYNLLSNAAKYSPHGGPIRLEMDTTSTAAVIAVTDAGVGIPAADQPKVFTQFFRASNINAQEIRGLGIGLYIARAIVEEHGGTITVASTVGVGSRFTVTLPLPTVDRPDANTPTEGAGTQPGAPL